MSKNLFQKLAEARKLIASTKMKKKGRNTFSKYDYFTPDQVHVLVEDSCQKVGIFPLYHLRKDELGYFAEMEIYNLDKPDESMSVELRTDIPEIKATNAAQKLGGMMTYTKRYLEMNIFGIIDNNLDFDADSQSRKTNYTPKKAVKMTDETRDLMLKFIEDGKGHVVQSKLSKYAKDDNYKKVELELKKKK